MPRYTDAEKLYKFRKAEVDTNGYAANYVFGWNDAIAKIENEAPTADVEPVRHAKWIELKNDPVFQKEYGDNKRVYYCSKCNRYITIDADVLAEYGGKTLYEKFPYCHCGAKMDTGRRKK